MGSFFKQSSFSRGIHNDAKLGAYYTNLNHAERIGQLFGWPEEEVSVLEPSIGDGSAVLQVLKDCPSHKVFGVELNSATCERLKQDGEIPFLLNEDFLRGVKISHQSFSFCFANPPYGTDQDSGKRLEQLFIEKMHGYLKGGAVLALVIPYYVLLEVGFLKAFISKFCPIATYRFDEDVYASFKQIVVVAQKRRGCGAMKKWREEYRESVDSLEKLPFLPKIGEDCRKIKILPSDSDGIEYFAPIRFNPVEHGRSLLKSGLHAEIASAFPKPYSAAELGRPPMPLKKDLLYVCAVSGGGQGLVGSEEVGDLHLQRGVVRRKCRQEVDMAEGSEGVVRETDFSSVALNIIENDGTITILE